jgi:hypothetical protein
MIEHEYSTDGVLLNVIDRRIFADVVEFQLAHFKANATQEILAFAPEHKQRNAALGILTQSETQLIKEKINAVVVHYNNCKALVNMVSWDGAVATHAEACDKVQAVVW